MFLRARISNPKVQTLLFYLLNQIVKRMYEIFLYKETFILLQSYYFETHIFYSLTSNSQRHFKSVN